MAIGTINSYSNQWDLAEVTNTKSVEQNQIKQDSNSPDIIKAFSQEAIAKSQVNSAAKGTRTVGDLLNPDWRFFLKHRPSPHNPETDDTKQVLSDFFTWMGDNYGVSESKLDSCLSCGACAANGGNLNAYPIGIFSQKFDPNLSL